MKKKIFGIIAILAITAVTAFNVNLNINGGEIASLSFANIEALATENDGKNKGEPTDREETRTVTVKKTNETGFSWDIGLNVWLFNGKVSKKSPTSSWEETTTVKDKYKCCKGGYDKPCDHIMCP